jgi:hypothetical protein
MLRPWKSAVYADRRWANPNIVKESEEHPHLRPAQKVICPACEAERDDVPSSYLHLDGDFRNRTAKKLNICFAMRLK